MAYNLETTKQLYGDKYYLAHNLKGETFSDDRHFFGARIPSVGLIDFGAVPANQKVRYRPLDYGITSDIMLLSLITFTTGATNDELTIRFFWEGNEIFEHKFASSQIPYTMPPGAIINPAMEIEVQSRFPMTQCLIPWQPVHVLQYDRVGGS